MTRTIRQHPGFRTRALLATTFVALAHPAVGGSPYDGRYRLTSETECDAGARDGTFLRIKDGLLTGKDSTCRMGNPVEIRGMDATLYDMDCTGGGRAWYERALFMHGAEDELILVWNGYAFAYPRCPLLETRPQPRPEGAD